MPQLGESVAEGTIGKWLKKPGDHVDKYEPLLEVITDKVNAEVPSPYEGILKEILVEEGATVPNNAEIAVIDEGDGAAAVSAPPAPPDAAPAAATSPSATQATSNTAAAVPEEAREPAATPATGSAAPPVPERQVPPSGAASPMTDASPAVAHGPAGSDERAPREMGNGASSGAQAGTGEEPRMTPAVRRLLREHGLEAAAIVGTGGGGRITREDVTDFVESQRTGQPVGKQNAAEPAAPRGKGGGASAPAGTPAGSTSAPAPAPAGGRAGEPPAPARGAAGVGAAIAFP